MSLERVRAYPKSKGYEDRIIIPEQSNATVAEAAAVLGCEPGMIAKTLSFLQNGADGKEEKAVLILAEGLARVDNRKYKERFGCKAKMIPADRVEMHVPVTVNNCKHLFEPIDKPSYACT